MRHSRHEGTGDPTSALVDPLVNKINSEPREVLLLEEVPVPSREAVTSSRPGRF
ncbi:MAG TPA: hypothetical protein VFT21_12695 [Gemmatimonadaceae bacterium]|nr:hypothetical protein [Gemmatimonadaceae bacterium]